MRRNRNFGGAYQNFFFRRTRPNFCSFGQETETILWHIITRITHLANTKFFLFCPRNKKYRLCLKFSNIIIEHDVVTYCYLCLTHVCFYQPLSFPIEKSASYVWAKIRQLPHNKKVHPGLRSNFKRSIEHQHLVNSNYIKVIKNRTKIVTAIA